MCLIPGLVLKQASQVASTPSHEPISSLRAEFNGNNNNDNNNTINSTTSSNRATSPKHHSNPGSPSCPTSSGCGPAGRAGGQFQHATPDGDAVGSPHSRRSSQSGRDGAADAPVRGQQLAGSAGSSYGDSCQATADESPGTSGGRKKSHFRPWLADSTNSSAKSELRKSSHPYIRITKSP